MEPFYEYLNQMTHEEHREKFADVLEWVNTQFPELEKRIAWNQPLFTHHGTFIIGFAYTKKHIAVNPEGTGIRHFATVFDERGLGYSKMTVRFPWNQPIDFDLLTQLIEFNIKDKKETKTFWRQ